MYFCVKKNLLKLLFSRKAMDIKSNDSSKQNRSRKNGSLIALTEVLRCSTRQLRDKWCNQLLYKLHIIHNVLENSHCSICLNSLKVDNENNLVIVNVLENVSNYTKLQTDMRFKAPELTSRNTKSKAGDVWATGICIYYINNLEFPWSIADDRDENYRLWKESGKFSSSLFHSKIVNKALVVDPKKRSKIEEIIKTTSNTEVDPITLSKFSLY